MARRRRIAHTPPRLFFRALDGVLHGVAVSLSGRRGKKLPRAERVRCIRSVPYIADGSRTHLLDVWLPTPYPGKSPVVIYFHGGGFAFGSKDTHRGAGLMFARRGFVTFTINYRLSPRYEYPASLEDACRAVAWIWKHLEHYGGDPERIVFAGESAGGNLTTMMAIVNSFRRPEPFAREVFDLGIPLRAAIPWCGWYFLTDHEVYRQNERLRFVVPVLKYLSSLYTGLPPETDDASEQALSHPLEILESDVVPDRPLPPFLIPIGTNDPLYYDSKRLRELLEAREVPVTWRVYPKAHHGFHLMPFTPQFRSCWRDVNEFVDGLHLREGTAARSEVEEATATVIEAKAAAS